MERFGTSKLEGFIPVSLKVRVESGCFHREHSPEAYRLIDQYLAGLGKPEVPFKFEEHESGPEILVYLAVTTAGLSLAKSVVELLTAIVKARSEGIKKGDRPSHPVEVIVRGHWEDGNYFEERIVRLPPDEAATTKLLEDAFIKQGPKPEKAKRKKK
jgi:hypothetical protein